MTEQRDQELYLLYREQRQAGGGPSKRLRRALALLLVIAAVICAACAGGVWYRYRTAKTFLEELYTVTGQDLADPQMRIERLRALAGEEVVEELLKANAVPAVYFHENDLPFTAYFQEDRRGFSAENLMRWDVVRVNGAMALRTGEKEVFFCSPEPAFFLSVESGEVTGFYAPLIRWADIAQAQAELLPVR